MPIRKQESGGAMIELRIQPGINGNVAGFALRREFCGDVIGIACFLKIGHMAGFASSGKTQVISDGSGFVALLAFHDGMRAEERKSVEVLRNRLDRYLPAENRVALGAIGAELTAVNIRVAIGTILANVGENRLHMAARAGYFFVHAAKGVTRGVVVKLGNGANRGPTCARVAIFAGNVQCSVRTSTGLPLSGCGYREGKSENYEQDPTSHFDHVANGCTISPWATLLQIKYGSFGTIDFHVSATQLCSGPDFGPVPLLPISIESPDHGRENAEQLEFQIPVVAFHANSSIGQN
jgi:hypothetical protein